MSFILVGIKYFFANIYYQNIYFMFLNRLGNKQKLAKDISKYFCKHSCYIELFFGAGGMFFNKPKSSYNILNDIDSNIYNCFSVLMRKKSELIKYLNYAPIDTNFWNECKTRQPDNEVEKAVYFLFLSNLGYLGKPDSLHFTPDKNSKNILLQNIEKTYLQLVNNGNMFMNVDFRNVLSNISFSHNYSKKNSFIYSDPPYFETAKYKKKWTEEDVNDNFNITFNSGINAAMSEFAHPFILETAKKHKLSVIPIKNRQTIKNRNTEILILNYNPTGVLFNIN